MTYLKRIALGDVYGWQACGREADGSPPRLCAFCSHADRCERAPVAFCLVFSPRSD